VRRERGGKGGVVPTTRREGGKRVVCQVVIALTIGFGLSDKRGHGVHVEKIQFAVITLSA
jgi:hypothetical protein